MATMLIGLGKTTVAVAGTPQVVVVPSTIRPARCHAFIVQALSTNTGQVYVGVSGLDRTSLVGVLARLPVPTINLIPTLSVAVQQAANSLQLDDLYIDADVNGEGVMISAMVA